jgi:hypothetical protein
LKFVFPAVSIRTMKKTNKTKETSRAKKVWKIFESFWGYHKKFEVILRVLRLCPKIWG